ncbi:bacillithiol system redox-active protein YtxJ [Jiulongibacter sp. NS-SX5]|uniref:bacillithiol system redox-active protein YtxJ n=1 Tax=Jiulongibacter sp. NS-SX5 TaxID=3463854 RepID=UPI0040582F2A
MEWNLLNTEEQLQDIIKESETQPVLIFKHSTTCPISGTAKSRMERKWNADEVGNLKVYYLDLLQYRPISNAIANTFGVEHESPQVLLIKNGKSVYTESHFGISFDDLKEAL